MTMNLKEYQTPCIKVVKVEIELPIAASNTFEQGGGTTGGGSATINGGSVGTGDAGSALVGGKRYFDSWDD